MEARFKYFKNDEGVYRVKIMDQFPSPRFMIDTDLMTAVIGSHRSKILNFASIDHAKKTVEQFLEKERMQRAMWDRIKNPPPPPPEPSDTFEEVPE